MNIYLNWATKKAKSLPEHALRTFRRNGLVLSAARRSQTLSPRLKKYNERIINEHSEKADLNPHLVGVKRKAASSAKTFIPAPRERN